MSIEMLEIIEKTIKSCNGITPGGISDEQLACEITAALVDAGYGKLDNNGLPIKIHRKEVMEMVRAKFKVDTITRSHAGAVEMTTINLK